MSLKNRRSECSGIYDKSFIIYFHTNAVNEEIMDFPKFSKLMNLDVYNDVQILSYRKC